ncbi:MAG TPA: hypothetical protein PK152_16950 [Anaerolineales bacterium]|nr:hypothetical protein [Anaerolineae bacterium]HRJ55555.1 hypothetical protein [Anaerolineales bacterium]HRK90820.1 hypothetical protein [Anaerolineales bacterium]
MSATEIACPFCGEMIKATAKKCRFCNEFLEEGLTRQAVLQDHAAGTPAVQEPVAAPAQAVQVAAAPAEAAPASQAAAAPAEAAAQPPAEAVAAAVTPSGLADLYAKVNALPDSDAKTKLLENLKALESQTDESDETAVEGIIHSVTEYAPDVAEIAISTLINPASGVTTLVQKVAMRISEGKKSG